MHVMIATDGSLDPGRTAQIAGSLAGTDGRVTVLSVVEVPRTVLAEMRRAADGFDEDAISEFTVEYRQDQAGDPPASHWIGDDAAVARYVRTKVHERTDDLAAALEATGTAFEIVGEEGENAAQHVLEATRGRNVDVLCIGTHGLGRFEGLLGSFASKLSRLAPCSVVLVR